jgi:uncharacterized protein YggU (UPF0235/DUF167 family)
VYGENEVALRIGARAQDGAANEELLAFLVGWSGLNKRAVALKSGATSRSKIVLIECGSATARDALIRKLQQEVASAK